MKYIHVTQVMSPYSDFSMIKPDVLNYASERGTRVHNIIHKILNDEWVPVSWLDPELKGFVDSFNIFKSQMILKTVFSEQKFSCELYGLKGMIDWGGYLKDRPKDFTILDWKTPLALQPTWKGQLAAYKHLARNLKPKRIGSLRLDRNGKPAKMTWYKDSAEVWEAYLCALTAYRYFKK